MFLDNKNSNLKPTSMYNSVDINSIKKISLNRLTGVLYTYPLNTTCLDISDKVLKWDDFLYLQ